MRAVKKQKLTQEEMELWKIWMELIVKKLQKETKK